MAESENNINTGAEVENTTESKTYSQEEVDRLIQAEADRRVNQALAKAERKNAEKTREAEKLARMSESEKYQYQLEQREQAIIAKEKELAMLENKNTASQILAEKGISLKLVDFVVDESADVMNDRIKLLDIEFKKSVRAEVEKRLGGSAPKAAKTDTSTITKEAFAKMSTTERQKLAMTDRDLYDSLTGRLK